MRTLIYIQNTYEYIHMILLFIIYTCMLIKLLISIYTLHLAFYENFFKLFVYLSCCCHNNKDDLKHHTCVYICLCVLTNICKYM